VFAWNNSIDHLASRLSERTVNALQKLERGAVYLLPQMLIEEYADVLTGLNKCQYPASGEKSAAFDAFFAADGGAQKHLGNFNKVILGMG
jgi:hypothetical protein